MNNSGPIYSLSVSAKGTQRPKSKLDCKWNFNRSWIVCFSQLFRQGMFLTHNTIIIKKCRNTDCYLWCIINHSIVGISSCENTELVSVYQKPSCLGCSIVNVIKSGQVPETGLFTENALLETYYATSCHKELDDGFDYSQDNYSMAVLKGDFQPWSNQRKRVAFYGNAYLSRLFCGRPARSCSICKDIISSTLHLVFGLFHKTLRSSVKQFSIKLTRIFLAASKTFILKSSNSVLNDIKNISK